MSLLRPCLAEFLGTTLLVLAGVGTAVIGGDTVGHVGIALAFGFALLALAYALGRSRAATSTPRSPSGCSSPPGSPPPAPAATSPPNSSAGSPVPDWSPRSPPAAQVSPSPPTGSAPTATTPPPPAATGCPRSRSPRWCSPSCWCSWCWPRHQIGEVAFAGIPIGITLVVTHLVAIPLDGTSVNPARSLGPALLTGGTALAQLGVFLLAPLVGAIAAALVQRALFAGTRPVPDDTSAVAR